MGMRGPKAETGIASANASAFIRGRRGGTARNERIWLVFIGALGGIRTPDPQIRSLVLYPAELRALKVAQHTVRPPIWKSRRPILALTVAFQPCYESRATTKRGPDKRGPEMDQSEPSPFTRLMGVKIISRTAQRTESE